MRLSLFAALTLAACAHRDTLPPSSANAAPVRADADVAADVRSIESSSSALSNAPELPSPAWSSSVADRFGGLELSRPDVPSVASQPPREIILACGLCMKKRAAIHQRAANRDGR